MAFSKALVKIAVPCGNYLHFLYDEEGPTFTRFPRDILLQYSRLARRELNSVYDETLVLPVETADINGVLSGFFHVLDFLKTYEEIASRQGRVFSKEMSLDHIEEFRHLLQIYYAVRVLDLDEGLGQAHLREKLLASLVIINVADIKFLWSHFLPLDGDLVRMAFGAVRGLAKKGRLAEEEYDELEAFAAENDLYGALLGSDRSDDEESPI